MLQEEVQVNEQLTSDEEVWDEWGNRFVTWSLSAAIAVLVSMSFLINFFLVWDNRNYRITVKMKADLELTLTHDGDIWKAYNELFMAEGDSFKSLDEQLARSIKLSGNFPGTKLANWGSI